MILIAGNDERSGLMTNSALTGRRKNYYSFTDSEKTETPDTRRTQANETKNRREPSLMKQWPVYMAQLC